MRSSHKAHGGQARMHANILIVTGIFPPDSGGPASYVPKMAAALREQGHDVDVVTLSDRRDHDDQSWGFPVHRIRRGLFWPWRILLTIWTIWRLARRKDLVYVNGLGSEAALGAWLAGRPTVHKIVGDYAWERAQARQWFPGTLDAYQVARKSWRLRLPDLIRTWPLRRAQRIIVPSEYLRRIVAGWGIPAERIGVIYNAAAEGATSFDSAGTMGPIRPMGPIGPATSPSPVTTLLTVCRLVPW